MVNDKIEICLNGQKYNARLDFMCIANIQYYMENIHEEGKYLKVPEIIKGIIEKEDWTLISSLLVEAILRCHPQLERKMIWANMKYCERDVIIKAVVDLIIMSMPQNDSKKKEEEEN